MEKEISPKFRKIKTRNPKRAPSLPEEIISEILSRLPVKSLLKFRCVSKSWCSLIGSKRFIKSHLQNSTKNTTFAHHRIILSSGSPHRLKHCSLNSLLNESFANNSFTVDGSINIQWESIFLVGCCNGLVCILLDRKNFILWNPSTRMSKKLPDIDDKLKHGNVAYYGFGCDESSGDYKVFGVIYGGNQEAIAKLYSLKSNSWKITKRGDSFSTRRGEFASGKLHWERIFGLDWDIVSFDLKSEVYVMVEQPSYSKGDFYRTLGVLGGCLSVLCSYQTTQLDVWAMKQYGVKESWDKVVTLPHLHGFRRSDSLTPFCIGPNGELLLIYLSNFIVCYPKDNGVRIINPYSFHKVDVYIESLVPLVPDGE